MTIAGAELAGAFVLTAGVASADGLRHREPDDVFPTHSAPYFNGMYFGGSLGFSHASVDVEHWVSESDTDFVGGLHLGHNIQHGNVVYGIGGAVNFGDSLDFSMSLRGRYGVISGSWLLYGTAGVAYASDDSDYWSYGYHFNGYDAVGLAVGGAAETRIGRNLVAGVEAIHTGYAQEDVAVASYDVSVDVDTFTMRGRFSWQFNGGGDRLK